MKQTPGSQITTYACKDKVHLHYDPTKTARIPTRHENKTAEVTSRWCENCEFILFYINWCHISYRHYWCHMTSTQKGHSGLVFRWEISFPRVESRIFLFSWKGYLASFILLLYSHFFFSVDWLCFIYWFDISIFFYLFLFLFSSFLCYARGAILLTNRWSRLRFYLVIWYSRDFRWRTIRLNNLTKIFSCGPP